MKLYKYLMLPVLAALTFTACEEEENGPSKAIIPGSSEIVLPAAATSQNVTIYADGTWIADVTDTWLSIDPTSGTGTMDVVLTADANVTDLAREAKIIVKGASTLNDIEITVTQKMDRFRETSACSVTEAVALKEGNLAKLSECQVMATTKGGFVVSDGKSNIFVQGTASVKAGDKLTLTGDVVAFNGLTAIKLEDAFVASSSEVSYSSAKEVDLSEAYAPGKVELLSATLSYNSGGDLSIDGKKVAAVYNPTSEQNEMAFHKVKITGYYLGTIKDVPAILPVIIEDIEMEAIPYLQFEIETAEFKNANPNFGTNHKFNAKVGGGYIEYVPDDLASSDPDGVWKMDLSGNDPRCTGPWPGDYWDIVGASPVKANSEFKIQFGSRVSATGHKYWMLEYLDGTVWKPVGQTKESTDMPDGENVEYTHAMNKDGGTNIIVDETFSITKNMDNLHVRFRCVTNWQANGKGPLAKRNTGSARLAISSDGSKGDASVVAPQPSILITKMGDGAATVDPEPEYANIELSTNLITFEGTPDAPKSLKVTSDRDFTLKSTVSWLSLSEEGGVADNQTEILVTCEPSELTTLRQGKIIIKSGDSQAEVNVVQSAAGQILEPFISIVGGNSVTVLGEGDEFSVNVQSNTTYEVECVDEWLSQIEAPQTKALVEVQPYSFKAAVNMTGVARTGHVRFFNKDLGIEAIVNVNQENFEPRITVLGGAVKISGTGATVSYSIDSNISFEASSSESWISLPASSGVSGTYSIPVVFEANTGSDVRTGTVTLANAEYGYTKTIDVVQYAAGIVFEDDFSWMQALVSEYQAAGTKIGMSVETNDPGASAPNCYSATPKLLAELISQGYIDIHPEWKVIYPQECYWKFSKTSDKAASTNGKYNVTGFILPELTGLGTALTVNFKWACHRRVVSGVDETDPVKLVVEVVKDIKADGKTAATYTVVYTSDPIETAQPLGQMEWQYASVVIPDVPEGCRILIHPENMKPENNTVNRWYIDDIKITK